MSSREVIVKPIFGGVKYLVPLHKLTVKSFSSHELSTSSLPMLSLQHQISCFSSPALTYNFSDIQRTLRHVCSSGYLVIDVVWWYQRRTLDSVVYDWCSLCQKYFHLNSIMWFLLTILKSDSFVFVIVGAHFTLLQCVEPVHFSDIVLSESWLLK